MTDLLWAADVATRGETVRAEFTVSGWFECTEPSVRKALFDATMDPRKVRPINSLMGVVDVDAANPPYVAALLFNEIRATDPNATFTFYGTGYQYPADPNGADPTSLDYANLHEVTKSTE